MNHESVHIKCSGKRPEISNTEIGYFLLRLTFGTNLFLHGVARLIEGHAAFLVYITKEMQAAPLPSWFLPPFAYILPWLEGSIGLLISLGLFTRNALVAGSLVLLVLQIGSSLAQNWPVVGDQLVYAVIFFILLTFSKRNRWSVDFVRTTFVTTLARPAQ
ncbi:MAG: thiosulfate dehydrogenase (quinone) large subunit [Acidobacteriaceae bacterium]|jgi:thiosulfate dehydrogenase [quinone] large subunit|nr:thiosulfate dehydrogenase (quinone) large subunit [Acidobacteriaceae bacterium]